MMFRARRSVLMAVVCAVSFVSTACDKEKGESTRPETASTGGAPAGFDPEGLSGQADYVLSEIETLEKKKDVTCWTSFRQLDQFIATKSYSEFATMAKIQSQKAMVRAVWRRASEASSGPEVTAADVEGAIELRDVVVSDERRQELKSFATDLGMKDFKDYRKTGEHWRVLLSVTQQAIYEGAEDLAPLRDEAAQKLSDVAMQLSLELLKESGKIATEMRSPFIEGEHVAKAHDRIAKHYELENPEREVEPISVKEVSEHLYPLTKGLIDAKIAALKHFNKEDPRSPLQTEDTLRALNEVSETKLTGDGLSAMVMQLRSFTRFVAGGLEPMRSDNYLSDGSFAPKKLPRKVYIDPVWMQNVIMQVWPHHVMPNGDIKLRFEPNPATILTTDVEARDILLLDYQQNAVRDSAIHWEILRTEFKERPYAMDPFAAELLSEVLSTMLTHYILEGGRIAKEMGKDAIDAEVARRLRDPRYVQVMPGTEEPREWSAEEKKQKQEVLEPYPEALFADVTAKSGLPTELDLDAIGEDIVKEDIQRVMGSGIAVGDPNGDGYPDLFLAGEGLGRLYLNRGEEAPGTFVDATKKWALPERMYDSRGALLIDIEGDGDDDLLVLRSGHPSRLFRNDGGKFTDVTKETGFAPHNGAHVASIFDYDGDGRLDIYVGFYGSDESNQGKARGRNLPAIDGRNGSPNQLWRQTKAWEFEEVGRKAGVDDVGWALATGTFDYDQDGDLDLYVANDFGRNAFLRNDGDGTFSDVSKETGTGDRGSGMNVSFSDVDGDGWFDFYLTNIDMFSKNIKVIFPTSETTIDVDRSLQQAFQYIAGNKLYMNVEDERHGRAFESEELQRFEPGDRGWAWDGNFFDYENDGDEDIYVSNGWIEGSYAHNQRNQMFIKEDGTFFLSNPDAPEGFEGNSRAVAGVDIDRDGDVDLVVNNFRQAPRVLENTQKAGNGWIQFTLAGPGANNESVGAVVTIVADGERQMRQVTGGRGYISQADTVVSFGLGDAESVDVSVTWPDGEKQTWKGMKAREVHHLEYGP